MEGSNSYLFFNAGKLYQFKVRDSEIKRYPLILGNISKNFAVKSTFSVYCNIFNIRNMIIFHKYLIEKCNIK